MFGKNAENSGNWTKERVELLKKLWLEGLSASQIAGVLGEGVTRNGVIGKVHRLKLAGRAHPTQPKVHGTPRPASQRPRVVRKNARTKKPQAAPVIEDLPPARAAVPKFDILENRPVFSIVGAHEGFMAGSIGKGLIDTYRDHTPIRSIVVGERGPQLPPEDRCNFMSAGAAGERCIHRKEHGKPYCFRHRDFQPVGAGFGSSLNGSSEIIRPH